MPGSIQFDDQAQSATINYSVPLPGSHLGRRIVRLDLGLLKSDWRSSSFEGESHAEAAGITKTASGYSVDSARSERFLRKKLRKIGYRSVDIDRALRALPGMLDGSVGAPALPPAGELPDDDGIWTGPAPDPREQLHAIVSEFADSASNGIVTTPVPDSTGGTTTAPSDVEREPDPQLFLIEKFAISSFLGDYGMGRTVRTFTLLPGESTTIRLKTWQSTRESIKQASSIVDSHHSEAKQRFENEVQNETTDKRTRAQEEKWSVEAEASASWGWGSAKVKGSASGAYQSSREQFAKQVSSSVSEHAKSASAKRELTVTSESETTEEAGSESVIERTINNVNMRRVLNFVFRELNQEYTTNLHLTDIKVGYTNGLDDSWREVPISGLRQLLSEVLVDSRVDEVAREILKFAAVVFNHADTPVRVLERIDYDPVNDQFTVSEIQFDPQTGMPTAPTDNQYYRFKRGPIDQGRVDGVLLSSQPIVMRTDSVLVEALLGEADALDEFAMEIQMATASERTLRNRRERLLQDTLEAVEDPVQRAELAARLFSQLETNNDEN